MSWYSRSGGDSPFLINLAVNLSMQPGTIENSGGGGLERLLTRFGLTLDVGPGDCDIPGSYWGAPEAGLIGDVVHARPDTPVHSVLHEACHYLCMTPGRRLHLNTDAGGSYEEENCVCFLQIVLAGFLPGFGRQRMMADMDAWGYSFRLGSAASWFARDSADAFSQLQAWGMLDAKGKPTWMMRGADAPARSAVRFA